MPVDQAKLNQFMEVYARALGNAVLEHPKEYVYSLSLVPTVVERMRAALESGSYNHDGRAFKGTCKALGIKHTRKEIEAFIRIPANV